MFPFGIWVPIVLPSVLAGYHRLLFPYDINGPVKQIMMSLFRLAWSSKIRLPLLITVAFLVLDVNLQVEINVFWAPVDREADRDNEERQRRRQNGTVENHQTRHAPPAPLAELEDLDEEEIESDPDSSGESLPSLDSSLEIYASAPHRYAFWDNGQRIPLHFDQREGAEGGDVEEEEESSAAAAAVPETSGSG